jgi:hypothetical protein
LPPNPSSKPIAQLERVKYLTQDLVDLIDLELLQHFKYPPWNRVTLYTVEISSLLKEEAAQIYNSNPYLGRNEVTIYTDVLFILKENSKGVGVGLVALDYS